MNTVRKKPDDWTTADIAAFWDWQSKQAKSQQQYFTAVMAPALARFLNQKGLLRGNVLDYGCGAGHMLEQLVKVQGVNFYGLDFSPQSIEAARARTRQHPGLKELVLADSLPVKFPDEQFDTILLIETIEHLQDDTLHETMNEIFRILKPKGSVFITTPFDENLDKNLNFCPFCKSEFHQMQHMQRFTVDSLEKLATEHGFAIESCVNTDIERLKLGTVKYFIKKLLVKLAVAAGLKDVVNNKTTNLLAFLVKP